MAAIEMDTAAQNLGFSQCPEIDDLAEQIGEFIHYWGFKRIHGRIWTFLFLADEPLDATELVQRMRISKALVSISLRELLEFGVIIRTGVGRRGTQVFRTNPDILAVILNVLRQREKRLLSRVTAAQAGAERLSEGELARNAVNPARVQALGGLVARASLALEGLIALRPVDFGEWRKAFLTIEDDLELGFGLGANPEPDDVREPSFDHAKPADHAYDTDSPAWMTAQTSASIDLPRGQGQPYR